MKTWLIGFITCVVAYAHAAGAATFTVDTTNDGVDSHPGDGTCMSQSGRCTLRAAVQEANALPGADAIVIPAGPFNLIIPGRKEDAAATGDLDITEDLTISGVSAAATRVGGYSVDRVFDVHDPAHLTLSKVTITAGLTSAGEDGGGMLNTGTITINDVKFLGNRAGYGGNGGGLDNQGNAVLQTVAFSRNAAGDAHADFWGGWGGGLRNRGTIELTDVIFSSNRAGKGSRPVDINSSPGEPGAGGGMSNDEGTATLTRVTFTKNRAGNGRYDTDGGGGGGMVNWGMATLSMVTFRSNRAGDGSSGPNTGGAGGSGGGLENYRGPMSLTDVRFTRNRAGKAGNGGRGDDGVTQHGGGDGGWGGGMHSRQNDTPLTNVTLDGNSAGNGGSPGGEGGSGGGFAGGSISTNVTIAKNRAGNSGGNYGAGGNGGGLSGSGTLTNVTIAANRAGKGVGYASYAGEGDQLDFYGGNVANTIVTGSTLNCHSYSSGITSLGHNLDSGASCNFAASSDLTNTDPHLDTLKSNGGFTPTLALKVSSAAIDAGDDGACPATDQRGVTRPQGAACDIGAYEVVP